MEYTSNLKLLNECHNMFGECNDSIKNRIITFLNDPTNDNWTNISSIIISPTKTIWQCIIDFDMTFQKSASYIDEEYTKIKWDRVPSPWEVLRAIQNHVRG